MLDPNARQIDEPNRSGVQQGDEDERNYQPTKDA
jgi:hypothetical protein